LRFAILICLALQLHGCATPSSVKATTARARRYLDSTIIEAVKFNDTPLREAVRLLGDRSAKSRPQEVQIKVLIPENYSEPNVNLELQKMSLRSAIKLLAMSVGWVYRIEDNRITVLPRR